MDERKQPPPLPQPLATFALRAPLNREDYHRPDRTTRAMVVLVKGSGKFKRSDIRRAQHRQWVG